VKFDPRIHHRRRSIRLQEYDYSQAGAYFVTICAWQRECLFGEIVAGEMHLNALGKIVQWEWRHLGAGFANLQLGAFVVMPNHVPGIIFIDERGRATRHKQSSATNGNGKSPDDVMEGIVGSPVRGAGEVGATQAGQTGQSSGTEIQSKMDMPGRGGSPMGGQGETIDMANDTGSSPYGQVEAMDPGFDSLDGVLDGPGRAIRSGENLIMNGVCLVPDEAMEGMGVSPVHQHLYQPEAKGPPSESLGAMIGQWKSRVTKRAWKLPGMQGRPIWQRNYYEHIIRDDADLRRIEGYIQDNPLLWEQDQLHPQALPNKF